MGWLDFIPDAWRARRAAEVPASKPPRLIGDAQQALINYGQADGKIRSARPETVTYLQDHEIEALSSTGLGRRLTWGVAGDVLSRGWSTEEGAEELEQALGLRAILTTGYATARQYGGANVFMVTRDGLPLSEPLPPGPHEILALHVMTARDARVRTYETDPRSPRWGKPLLWDVQPVRPGVSVRSMTVHASRMAYIPGLTRSPSQTPKRAGYDLSALDAYWPAIRNLELAVETATRGAIELSTRWVRLKESMHALGADQGPEADERLAVFQASMSMANLGVLFGDDETGRDNVTLSGLRTEVIVGAYEAVSSVEGIPLTALIGMAPAGLSTDDASGQRTYNRALESIRETRLTPALSKILEVATGAVPQITWDPLVEESAADLAALATSFIAEPDELRARARLPRRVAEDVEPEEDEIETARQALRLAQ